MKIKTILLLSTALSVYLSIPFAHAAAQTNATAAFMTIADIHFDPFVSCNKNVKPCPLIKQLMAANPDQWETIFENNDHSSAQYHEDTNYSLLKSAKTAWQNASTSQHPQFALILGDFLAHNYRNNYHYYSGDKTQAGYESFVSKTLVFLMQEIKSALPNINIYPVVGNNDSYRGDYKVIPNGSFFKETAGTWKVMINQNEENRNDFFKGFSESGYYAAMINPTLKVIVLNTVLFSANVNTVAAKRAALQQLDWLQSQLKQSEQKHQHVFVAFHIPVGVDIYKTIKMGFTGIQEFWQTDYSNQFRDILKNNVATITGIFPAHTHMDSFQILSFNDGAAQIPVSATPSISPIFGNNPAFKIYWYDTKNQHIKDFSVYYAQLNQSTLEWKKEYSFNETYDSGCHFSCNLLRGMHSFTKNLTLMDPYQKYYAVLAASQPITQSKYGLSMYRCGVYSVTQQDFQSCMSA